MAAALAKALSEKVKAKIKEHVLAYPARWRTGVCSYVVLDRETGEYTKRDRSSTGDICHAGMLYHKDSEPVVVNAHKPKWAKEHPEFCRWVLQQSPFSHGILNRNDEDELFNHAAVLDFSLIGCAGALWICKAMRHFTEDSWKIPIWEQLCARGLNGLQAFIGSDILDAEGSPAGQTHVSLFTYSKPEELRAIYDKISREKKREGEEAHTRAPNRYRYDYAMPDNWGSLKGKKEKLPDGWGGYTEVTRPCSAEEYAAKLKEIFEGRPENVK